MFSLFVSFGQAVPKYTPISKAIQGKDYKHYCIKAHFAGIHDSSKLIFFVEENDYIIPIQLQKRDLGAEKRFRAMNLNEGDIVAVKGVLNDIDIDSETYKGLIDAIFINEEDVPAEETHAEKNDDELTLSDLDVQPLFNGGEVNVFTMWVNGQLKYPEIAKENGIQGRVTLQFTIEKDGRITNVTVVRGVDASLDNEAVRVVSKSPKWSPGYKDGKPVRVTYTFPVIFQLR